MAQMITITGKKVLYSPKVAEYVGGVNPAILLNQLLYWTNRKGPGEWIYKSAEDFEIELYLTSKQQRSARASLIKLGILEYKRTHPPLSNAVVSHYRIDLERLVSILPKGQVGFIQKGKSDFAQMEKSLNKELKQKSTSTRGTSSSSENILPTPPNDGHREEEESPVVSFLEVEFPKLFSQALTKQSRANLREASNLLTKHDEAERDLLLAYVKENEINSPARILKLARVWKKHTPKQITEPAGYAGLREWQRRRQEKQAFV